jgi:hypothetical protein
MLTGVTGATGMLLALGWLVLAEPAAARSRHHRSHAAPVEETAAKPKNAVAASRVPLPQPRPAEAPPRALTEVAKGKDQAGKSDGKDSGKDNAKEEAAGPPPPSACRLALTDEIAIAPSIPSIHGPGACGGDDLVRLEAVVLPDKTRVALTPVGIMRCTMATAVVNWVRNDVAPEVAKLGSEIKALDNFDSYECRGRNGVPGAQLSEHGKANAIDVHGFKLADGRMIELTDRTQPREFRETVLRSACTRFPTVLGPDSDWHHEDHIHLDLIERHSNYRICQWDVLDPMPKVAPLLPEMRPGDAPPREVAEAARPSDKTKGQADAKGVDAKGIAVKNGEAKSSDKSSDKSSEAKADGAGNTGRAGNDKAGKDAKQDAGAPSGKVATATGGEASAPPKPAAATPAVKPPSDTAAKDKPESKPATEPKAADAQVAPDKPSTVKSTAAQAATDKTATEKSASEKSSPDKATSAKSSPEKAAPEKASRRKIAAERPRRHRHRARMWNPFAGFF